MKKSLIVWCLAVLAPLVQGCLPSEPDPASFAPPVVESGGWRRKKLGDMPAQWAPRDGAQMVQLATGRILMIGGWSANDPWGPNGGKGADRGGDRVTNEVWKSDDKGATWELLLPHEKKPASTGPSARFPPVHTVGVVAHEGHALVLGTDPLDETITYLGDVWRESDDGRTWTRVSTTAPTLARTLFMCGTYKGAIYVMGGQRLLQEPSTSFNDVWRSTDGGVTWTELPKAPWSPRGMVYRPVEHDGKLVIVGGGRYSTGNDRSVAFNGVFAFDGTSWQTVLPDGHAQFQASYYNAVASVERRLWLVGGYDPVVEDELVRAAFSDDGGLTWGAFPGGAGGAESHADAMLTVGDRVLRISGNLGERAIWEIAPIR